MRPEPRDLRPLALAASTAVVALALVVSGAFHGWLGPDAGRGDGFCEAAVSGWVRQPANTWSNLAFVAAGLAVAWRAGAPDGRLWPHPRLAAALAVVIVLAVHPVPELALVQIDHLATEEGAHFLDEG